MQPVAIPSETLITKNNKLIETLNTYGVAIIPLNKIQKEQRNKALEVTKFYANANEILKAEHQISELTLKEKLNPKTIKQRKAPDSSQGWINQYNTVLHHMIEQDSDFREAMNIIDGKPVTKFMQNRMRLGSKTFKFDKKSLHFDGHPFEKPDKNGNIRFTENPLTATIIGLTGIRRFCWWDINGQNLKPIYDHWVKKGKKVFTNIDPDFMEKTYPGCRRFVDVDCSEKIHLIIFRECIPHEIASSPSISIFISPIKEFDKKKEKVTSFHPPEYKNLTKHETNILGFCYHRNGVVWPSGKKSWAFCHNRAYTHWVKKVKPRYIQKNKNNKDTIMMQLPTNGRYDQHTSQYKQRLAERNIKLPSVAFLQSTPNFIVNIAEMPDVILKDHGFIQ